MNDPKNRAALRKLLEALLVTDADFNFTPIAFDFIPIELSFNAIDRDFAGMESS